ncbi:MAG: bile acid:sodium symporter family protein [Gammaproteobacteria bacterium]|nr:bile acid:sodium symporter family protein [Gammaproteobacteria bacterium]NIR97656.1 bile acid:sodium symporter family protein [Gammaproteobacteria bacterium]NIT63317.1 bile acid:sodium symporter family protein [Gammaproteobacteria bacterium]NIV20235.1 bile acid:sodium symporter [Gammaproteobacteria bacterium]NIX10652.1 bile acid:sodium symporter [Gammaproteobacteria bacterium]
MIARLTSLFPLWALLFSAMAYYAPHWFAPARPAIVPLLGVVMLGMGMTLTPANFARVARRPLPVALGAGLQFVLMPLIAWVLALAFGLSPYLAAGMILVGASPGGTASNVVCYLARGDVALSITLTSVSTLLAVLATPVLTWLYAGHMVPVPVGKMLQTILGIVIVPVLAGVVLNAYLGQRLAPLKRVFPLVSVLAIVSIIAIIVALQRKALAALAAPLAAGLVLHNLLGLAGGYWVPRVLGYGPRLCRTLAIEVGMQNSGLAVALASQHFSTLAALPGALFSIWHNLSGSLLAARWSTRPPAQHEL